MPTANRRGLTPAMKRRRDLLALLASDVTGEVTERDVRAFIPELTGSQLIQIAHSREVKTLYRGTLGAGELYWQITPAGRERLAKLERGEA